MTIINMTIDIHFAIEPVVNLHNIYFNTAVNNTNPMPQRTSGVRCVRRVTIPKCFACLSNHLACAY